jgi:hypothetical protein
MIPGPPSASRQRGWGETFRAVRILWYFVVGLWPILYALVYLA